MRASNSTDLVRMNGRRPAELPEDLWCWEFLEDGELIKIFF